MTAPTSERGYQVSTPKGMGWWPQVEDEPTPELRWPLSIDVYDRMRRQDAQVTSVLRAVTLPIRRTPWRIDPAGCRPEVVQLVADDFGLPVKGQDPLPLPRTRDRFSWVEHLRLALTMLPFGHSVFEQVARIDDAGRAHLRKLAWRPPRSISEFEVADDGGLEAIKQHGINTAGERTIPVDRLAVYVNDREGGNWAGQALAPETPIPTPDGWRVMADLRPGDRVFDEQGMVRHVVARQDWTDRPCYRVTFGDGESIVADENHLWLTHDFRYRCQGRGAPAVRTTRELAETVVAGKSGTSNHTIPLAGAVQHVRQHLIVDPYVLGYWLGDGCKGSGRIVSMDDEIQDLFAERGYPCEKSTSWETSRAWNVKGLATDLRYLGVLDHKHVPEHYLQGSIDQRFDLLRGLMDSDGCVSRDGQGIFANTDPLLAAAVLELVRSLGIRATMSVGRQAGRVSQAPAGGEIRSRHDVYHVQFATHLPVVALSRKLERLRPDNIRRRNHVIKAVEPVERRDTICIEVDAPSHLFLAGRGFVPTHNSLLRPAYKFWLLKDRALRTQAQTIERNGLGIPLYESGPYPDDLDPTDRKTREDAEVADGAELAAAARAGDNSGLAIRNGAGFSLVGVSGTLPDADPVIRYYDEQIARAVLAHFLNLGTETGSWALGSTFADFFTLGLQTVAQDIADTTNQHVVEDLVDWNFGPEEPAPRIVFDEIGSRAPATAQAIQQLVACGALTPDEPLEQFVRTTYGLPAADPSTARSAPAPAPTSPGTGAPAQTGQTQQPQQEPTRRLV